MEVVPSGAQMVTYENAYGLEKRDELNKAFSWYEKLLKKSPADLKILSRLMIVSRKLKNYSKEITFIDQAIATYEKRYQQLKSKDAKVEALSKKINVLLGHTNKRGKNLLDIPEVSKLKKRKEVALKRKKSSRK